MYGTLQIAKEHNIKADNVEEVIITTACHLAFDAGAEKKRQPQTVSDAIHSFYWAVATALVKGGIWLEDFTQEALNNPEVLALARRIKVDASPARDKKLPQVVLPPTDIEIRTKDGKYYKREQEIAMPGHPDNPWTYDDVSNKLRKCAPWAIRPLPSDNIEKIIQMVRSLDKISDVTTILEYL